MGYNSLEQIRSELNIDADSVEEIDKALKSIQIALVPKGSEESFNSEEDKQKYNKVISGREYIKKLKKERSLTKIESNGLVYQLLKELVPSQKKQALSDALDRKSSNAIIAYHSSGRSIKITSGGITAVLTFLFLSPTTISDHPLLKKLVDPASPLFMIIWLSTLCYTGLFWYLVFRREEHAKRKIQQLKTESFQNRLLNDFARGKNVFTKDELSRYILGRSERKKTILSFLTAPVIDLDITDSVADLIIERALTQNMIEILPVKSLSRKYRILFEAEEAVINVDEEFANRG